MRGGRLVGAGHRSGGGLGSGGGGLGGSGLGGGGLGGGGLGSDPLYTPHLPPIDYDSGSHFPTGALIGIIGGLVALVSTLARRR